LKKLLTKAYTIISNNKTLQFTLALFLALYVFFLYKLAKKALSILKVYSPLMF